LVVINGIISCDWGIGIAFKINRKNNGYANTKNKLYKIKYDGNFIPAYTGRGNYRAKWFVHYISGNIDWIACLI